ncbi:MAG: sulfite exporter TauE/SafE family protein [Flavobacteriales bacterium]|nr:sulfite exporter TauE/SafE family protein [Flavobacteriales bacterium]
MELAIVISVALAGSFLSFFTGFGLGTLLLPAFMLVFPPHIAIAATAVVHLLNNIFKLFLVGRYADRSIIFTFGALSVVGAIGGALLLDVMMNTGTLVSYSIGHHVFEITWIKLVIAILILVFSLLETLPVFNSLEMPRNWLPAGGLLSGFFGGLSGHQGALRSAFLMKAGLSKEAFMGTRVVCAVMVDVSRIAVYSTQMGYLAGGWNEIDPIIIIVATLAALTGAYLGNRYMKKSTLKWIQNLVTVSLVLFALALGAGLI